MLCITVASYFSCVERRAEVRVHKKDIFWLQVSVGELVVVQKLDSIAQLIGNVADLIHRVRLVIVVFEEVEYAETEHFKSNASMAVVVKPVQDLNT